MSVNSGSCPVCLCTIHMDELNQHVNECLNKSQTKSGDQKLPTSLKRKSVEPESETESHRTDFSKQNIETSTVTSNAHAPKRQRNLLETFGKDNKPEKTTPSNPILTKFQSNSKPKLFSTSKNTSSLDSSGSHTTNSKPQKSTKSNIPLAEAMRPSNLGDFIGQEQAIGSKSILCSLVKKSKAPSLIAWGPPGCGKTTLVRIIANTHKQRHNTKFVQLSATSSGVGEVREVIKVARTDRTMFRRDTIVFIDEIHRFNKSQQDTLLPHIEDGTIIMMGATTENPSFQVNSALLSRCKVIVMEKLTQKDIQAILIRAVCKMGGKLTGTIIMDACHSNIVAVETDTDTCQSNGVAVEADSDTCQSNVGSVEADSDTCQSSTVTLVTSPLDDVMNVVTENGQNCADEQFTISQSTIQVLASLCDGDARVALNSLQMAAQAVEIDGTENNPGNCVSLQELPEITVDLVKEGLQRSHVLYDKTGDEHYNCISALHKSIRGSDPNGALYWLARMLEGGETPLYVARRLIRIASEDIGLADPQALTQAVSTHQACHFLGMPECDVILAQCVVYLCRCPKSIEVYQAYKNVKCHLQNHKGPLPGVPLHLRNAPTRFMKDLGYGEGYKYNPDYPEPVEQTYLPSQLIGTDFFTDN